MSHLHHPTPLSLLPDLASQLLSSRTNRRISSGGGEWSPWSPTTPIEIGKTLAGALLPPIPTYFCEICLARHTEVEGFELSCGHKFCQEPCLTDYLVSKLNGPRIPITCVLFPRCKEEFCEANVRKILSKHNDQLLKYERFVASMRDPEARECPACKAFMHGSAEEPIMICNSCSHRFCFLHSDAHRGQTCEFYLEQIASEERESATLLEGGKPCPNRSCGVLIQKESGW